MKLLVMDECGFTRLGVASCFNDPLLASVTCCQDLQSALSLLTTIKPSHILLNLTDYCRYSENTPLMQTLFNAARQSTLYIYLDTPYPYSNIPMQIADNTFLFNKVAMLDVLNLLRDNPVALMNKEHYSLFSPQELSVMKYWMSEIPNYRIAKKLHISTHTVYVHKRHITEKVNVRNRLEFYSLYNVLRYFYPSTTLSARPSMALAALSPR
ncbi:helix-turn-helix transcriptional regulator [Serratia sp. S1B]|nr:helix-turn-helix transcriptional regulator [Serratia sp. S1B]